ncbi:ECA oligosaccharide polymerase [Thorsellia anophelis]|uniref:Antigen polymerase n=1 Tax=Thorsellia anophelis DSM 18579 TaxID=1123402 RepID=A0A1H9YRD2_9GAMM|nr:ECA oligosaccharide polymerase [Thorsellia anophelis]SES71705.1 antigen polymerase [Thorsellia anophelis DSM 18579]
MSLPELSLLLVIYLFSIGFVGLMTIKAYQRDKFNFHILFSLLFLLTFYFGFPFTVMLIFGYQVQVETTTSLAYTLLSATLFYGIYSLAYHTKLIPAKSTYNRNKAKPLLNFTRLEVYLTVLFLAFISIGTLGVFFIQNGFLLFKLDGYSEIFSSGVSGVALKRFFYFFIPAMLVVYFLKPTQIRWLLFLGICTAFGLFTYIVVGGTRANILIAFALFLFIGITRGWITLWMLILAGLLGVVGMFALAIMRYGLDVSGPEAFYHFLYLTRDTFSPWQSVAKIFDNYDKIETQGLMPILRDFYVFIPKSLWPERPDTIVNTANYFTWELLNIFSGLAYSPTMLGSILIMGGVALIPFGAIFVAWVIRAFDVLYKSGSEETNIYRAAILKAFCFGAIFNIIVLVREGIDAFFSRLIFFVIIFALCVLLAKIVYWMLVAGKYVYFKIRRMV